MLVWLGAPDFANLVSLKEPKGGYCAFDSLYYGGEMPCVAMLMAGPQLKKKTIDLAFDFLQSQEHVSRTNLPMNNSLLI